MINVRRAGPSRSPGKDKTMYDFAKEFVIYSGFGMVMAIDVIGIGYWVYSFAKWLKKIWHKRKNGKEQ